jgi:ABC-type Fe2+-enterobactin transport system substrate-binding protein
MTQAFLDHRKIGREIVGPRKELRARLKSFRRARTKSRSAIKLPHSQLLVLSRKTPGGKRSLWRNPPGFVRSASPIPTAIETVRRRSSGGSPAG